MPWQALPELGLRWYLARARSVDGMANLLAEVLALPDGLLPPVAAHVARELRRAPPQDWLQQFGRRIELARERARRIDLLPADDRTELWALASFAANGFVRQLACERLAAAAEPRGLLPLVLRTGDWVANVRAAALVACEQVLPGCSLRQVLAVYAIVGDWLDRRDHAEMRAIAARLDAALRAPQRRADVRDLLLDPAVTERRFLLQRVLPDLEVATLRAVLTAHGDVGMREAVAVHVATTGAVQDELVDAILRDRSSRVPSRFVLALPGVAVARLAPRLVPLCSSTRTTVRRVTAAALARAGVEPAAEARRRLAACAVAAARPDPGVVLCLGECGRAADADLVRTWAHDGDERLHAAVLEALGRLEGPVWIQTALEALAGGPPLRRAAQNLLARLERWRWIEVVRELALAGGDASIPAFRLLVTQRRGVGWPAIPDLLLTILHRPPLRDRAWGLLHGWCQRNLTRGWLRPDAVTGAWLERAWSEWRRQEPPVPPVAADTFPRLRRWIEDVLAPSD